MSPSISTNTSTNGTHKIPIAIIGGGSIAPYHAKYIISSPTCQLVAIIDPFPSGLTLANRLSIAHYPDIPSLLSSSTTQPEIYYICVPSGLHVPLATQVLTHTSPSPKVILVEKPLCTDSASGTALLDLARTKNCIIAAGHHRRFHPAIQAAHATIQSQALGAITAISGQWTCKKGASYFDLAWRRSRAHGGGPIWTNFVHDLDLLHYLVGAPVTRVWVTPTTPRRVHATSTGSEVETEAGDQVEEGAAMMLRFANGVVGTFVVCDNVASPFYWEHATGENPLMPRAQSAIDCFRVFGVKGTLTVPDGNLWTYSAQKGKDGVEVGWGMSMVRETVEVDEGVPFREQLANLVGVARGVEKPVCSGEDGLVAVKVCEAILRALENGDGAPVDVV